MPTSRPRLSGVAIAAAWVIMLLGSSFGAIAIYCHRYLGVYHESSRVLLTRSMSVAPLRECGFWTCKACGSGSNVETRAYGTLRFIDHRTWKP
jgi:hypothetical protein